MVHIVGTRFYFNLKKIELNVSDFEQDMHFLVLCCPFHSSWPAYWYHCIMVLDSVSGDSLPDLWNKYL